MLPESPKKTREAMDDLLQIAYPVRLGTFLSSPPGETPMKRTMLTLAVLAALVTLGLMPSLSDACGRRRGACCESSRGCGSPCPAPCAPAPIQYVERVVTCYKPQMVEKEIVETVCRLVSKEVPYSYDIQVPVVTPTKQIVNVCKTVSEEVPYTYTVLVPHIVKTKRLVTTYQCVTKVVQEHVTCCRTIRVPVVDECGHCRYVCQTVTETRPVCRTVVERIPVQREVEVCQTVCDRVEKKGVRLVCKTVTVPQEVTVNVCSYKTEKKSGVRIVCEVVPEKVKRKVQICTMVPYQQTIRVPVCVPTPGCCETSGYYGGGRGGLFHRGGY
jgi:hypothetical protein